MTPTQRSSFGWGCSLRHPAPPGGLPSRWGFILRPGGASHMNVITVTREYGAGGYDVARRLAEGLGWELLDRERPHRPPAEEHLPDADLEGLDEKPITLPDRFRLPPPHQHYIHGLTEAARQAAAKGN